jgi:exonuclease III
MLLINWNVAAWATTIALINQHYGSLGAWMKRHGCDILTLQEVKLSTTKVADEPNACGAREAGLESAWSLYRPASVPASEPAQRKRAGSWNGVATFTLSGLLACADADPLGVADLDCEGRCLCTDHGAFSLFNVYVPTGSDLPLKLRFLRALRRAMAVKRASTARPVVLVGDLNLAMRAADVPWRERLVSLSRALGEDGAQPYADLPALLAAKLQRLGPSVRAVLATLELVSVPGRDEGKVGQYTRPHESWRATWRPPDGGRAVTLGKPHDDEGSARKRWAMISQDVVMPDPEDPAAPHLLLWKAGHLSVYHLQEVLVKAVGQPFSDEEARALAAHGESYSPPCLRDWASSLIQEDGMVDSFAEMHPNAQERFTCWQQHTNTRYDNGGIRIDYMFVDAALAGRIQRGAPLPKGSWPGDENAAEAAASAATAGGRWQPAPYDGSGMADAPLSVFDTQFEPPATGIRYMPPRYSDHTATSLLLADVDEEATPLTLRLDATTLKACPHRQSRTITSFFAPRPPGAVAEEVPPAGNGDKKRKAAEPARPPGQKSVRDMFDVGGRQRQGT